MLVNALKMSDIEHNLKSCADYHPFPRACEREKWNALPQEARWFFTSSAGALKGCAWPELSCVRYLDFVRNGNRVNYENNYFKRRDMLYTLLMGECFSGNGDYIDDIANGIWAICEESSWVLPAHNNHDATSMRALPDVENTPYIDLFSAETASLLGWAYYMLPTELDSVSPLVRRRIEFELNRRIFDSFLSDKKFPWSGFDGGFMNNWNPWINSNLIACTLCVCEDNQKRCAMIEKSVRSLQHFIDSYACDGGCDEGPSYFDAAGAALFDALEELHYATDGRIDEFDSNKISNMGTYIMYMHIADTKHVNFADASPEIKPDCMQLIRYGKACNCSELVEYAHGMLAGGNAQPVLSIRHNRIYRGIADIMMYTYDIMRNASVHEPLQHYFDGIQVLTARSKANDANGLFLAAKAGHNAESHNHNDVGNYIIYVNGEAAICDVGVETYSRCTFSAERYTIWAMCSDWHNTAIINGCNQLPGKDYSACDVHCDEGTSPALTMDIAGAYPKNAGVKSYVRTVRLDRENGAVNVHDTLTATDGEVTLSIPIVCAVEPQLRDGYALLDVGSDKLRIRYDVDKFTAEVQCKALTDPKLQKEWRRPNLYRLMLTLRSTTTNEEIDIVYELDK